MSESIWVKSTNHSSIIQNEYSHIFYTILSIIALPLSQVFSQSRKLWWFSRNNGLWPRLRCRIAGVEIPGRHLGTISTLARKSGIYFITVSPSPCTKWTKIPTTSEQSVLRFQSLPSLLVTMTVVGVLDTFPLMPGTDHIPIVFNVRILILWHILCLTLPPICRDGGSRELRHGRTRQLLRPGQDLINSVSIFTSKNITTHDILDFILVSQHSSVLHILKTFYLQIYRCHSNIRDKWCSRCVHLLLGWLV